MTENINEEFGHEKPKTKPFYVGFLLKGGHVVARTGCCYEDKVITADNGLSATAEMILFEHDSGNTLNKETEVKPLLDLMIANLSRHGGIINALRENGTTKSCEEFLREGLQKLESEELLSPGTGARLWSVLEAHQDFWPRDIIGRIILARSLFREPRAKTLAL